jgi:hypothetical protein
MNRILLLFWLSIIALLVCSCRNGGTRSGGVEVFVEGGDRFPEKLAGTWQPTESYWRFTFEPDGRISKAAIGLGGVEIVPGKITRSPSWAGGEGIYKPGLWTVNYSYDTNDLIVKVVIDYFRQDMGPSALEGSTADILTGPVSEDGTTWWPAWYSAQKYTAIILGQEPNEFENVAEPEYRQTLVFEKIRDDEQAPE